MQSNGSRSPRTWYNARRGIGRTRCRRTSDRPRGRKEIDSALSPYDFPCRNPYGLAFPAEDLAWHSDRAAALAALQQGLELARTTGEHGLDAENRRLAGTADTAFDDAHGIVRGRARRVAHQPKSELGSLVAVVAPEAPALR